MQRTQQVTKLRLPILRTDAESLEHFVLQLRLINSHAAAADLNTIQNDVISLGVNLREFFLVKQRHILRFRACKGMMHGIPFVFFRAPLKQREIGDPEEIPNFG